MNKDTVSRAFCVATSVARVLAKIPMVVIFNLSVGCKAFRRELANGARDNQINLYCSPVYKATTKNEKEFRMIQKDINFSDLHFFVKTENKDTTVTLK